MCVGFFRTSVFALDTAQELQNKIDAQSKNIDAIAKEIANFQKELDILATSKNTLSNTIATLTLESKKLSASIKVTESKITSANLKIQSLGGSIVQTSDRIKSLKQGIAKGIREIADADNRSLEEILSSNEPLYDVWKVQAQNEQLFTLIRDKNSELKSTKQSLEKDKSAVEKIKGELVSLKADLATQQKINKQTQNEKTALLKQTKNQEANYQKLVSEKLALKKQMEADLAGYEAQLKYVLNPNNLPKPGSHPLAWPLDYVKITQYFGVSSSAKRLYATGSHNGVDFRASTGTPVKAMASGVVIDSGNTDLTCKGASYGVWVLIRYTNGLSSVYGHLSEVRAQNGQTVRTGDIVAFSGGTGYATGPHLHVSLFPSDAVKVASFPSTSCKGKIYTMPVAATNAYLDAMQYLPNY